MLLLGVQVHWLPSGTDRYLHSATLLALAATDFGKHLIDTTLHLNDGLDDLALVSKCASDEAMITMVVARPMTLAVARWMITCRLHSFLRSHSTKADAAVTIKGTNMHQLKVLSCNRNGDHRRSKLCIYNLYNRHHISCVQESSFSTRNAFDTFRAQSQAALGGRLFVNDSGATSDSALHGKHGRVFTILHADLHGGGTAQHMSGIDVVNRYLVDRLQWGDRDVYIHNVYAPVDPQERTTFL